MINCQRRGRRLEMSESAQRRHVSTGGTDIDILQRFRALPEARGHFHHHMVLVQLSVERRYQPLPERIVERVVDHLRRDPQPGRGVPIDPERDSQASVLLVAGNIAELRQGLELLHQPRRPCLELRGIGVFDGVLKLCPAHTILHGQVLDRLHEQSDAFHLRQFRLESSDDVAGTHSAFFERLQVDQDSPAVHRDVGPVHADE